MGKIKVLITGGAGFIGSHLTEELLRSGLHVTVVDDFSAGRVANLKACLDSPNLDIFSLSITNFRKLQKVCNGMTYIFHLAAMPSVPRSLRDPKATNRANVNGTLNVLCAAKKAGVAKVVYASSSSVYGNASALPAKESMLPSPLSPYAASKLAGECYCASFTASYGLPTVCLRYFNVYGPRQNPALKNPAVIPGFIESIKQGKPPVIFGSGLQTRDFTFVKDVVNANILAAKSKATGVFNVGTGVNISLRSLAKNISAVMGRGDLTPVFDDPRPGDVAQSLADISKARAELNYMPQVTLEQGLKITLKEARK